MSGRAPESILRRTAAATPPPRAGTRGAGPRPARRPRHDRHARIFVVGRAPFAPEVAAITAARLGAGTHVNVLEKALLEADEATLALILAVDPSQRGGVGEGERQLAEIAAHAELARVHRFVVVPDQRPETLPRRFYRASASAVFDWPRERDVFPDLLVELLGTDPGRARMGDGDRALGKVVRARLKLMRLGHERLGATARSGIVILTGETDAAIRKREIVEEIEHIPGVRHVIAKRLGVETRDGRSDREIARGVRKLVGLLRRREGGVDVGVDVEDGVVRLHGEVEGGAESQRLSWLAANLPGVADVENETSVVAPAGVRPGRLVARLLARIRSRFPDAKVALRHHDGVLELEGDVPVLAQRRTIREICESEAGVERVVDKLRVAPEAGS